MTNKPNKEDNVKVGEEKWVDEFYTRFSTFKIHWSTPLGIQKEMFDFVQRMREETRLKALSEAEEALPKYTECSTYGDSETWARGNTSGFGEYRLNALESINRLKNQ